MASIGAQRLILPTLGCRSMWELSGRWKTQDSQLFFVKDRSEKEFCLQPTHEEEITSLIRTLNLSYKQLPLLVYQISSKFRDELRPRYGLIRCREFIMKDLYSFDATHKDALMTYHNICQVYAELFNKLQLPYHKVLADAGHIGGHLSHEFHLPISIGEDRLHVCTKCGFGYNAELEEEFQRSGFMHSSSSGDELKTEHCSHTFKEVRGIEIAHCFLLGQRYSKCFDATFTSPNGKSLYEMGCYGIGMSRLLAAAVEYLTAAAFPNVPVEQVTELRWPPGLAPFSGALALQKESARDALDPNDLQSILDTVSHTSDGGNFIQVVHGDFLVDDRSGLTLGRKLVDLKRLGIPWIVLLKAQHCAQPVYELVDVYNNVSYEASLEQVRAAFQHPSVFKPNDLPRWNRKDRSTETKE